MARKILAAFAAAASLVSFAPEAQATTTNVLFQIDDLSDDQITLSQFINGVLIETVPVGESFFVSPNFTSTGLIFANFINLSQVNIYEPGGVTLSDTYASFAGKGVSILPIHFNSDVEGGPPLTPGDNSVSLIENGDWQTVFSAPLMDSTGTIAGNVTVQFRSDVETPLPAALPLFATGLGLLSFIFVGSRLAIPTK
jgi:hypothetical protein